jgi:hypothetical protein
MLKSFMRPVKGEGAYTPGRREAARAHGAFKTYVRGKLVDNFEFVVPDRLSPPHIDATLSLLLEDGEVGVIGEPHTLDTRGHWAYLAAGELIVRYVGIDIKKELWRFDMPADQAAALDHGLRMAHATPDLLEARTALVANAIESGALPHVVVGAQEFTDLAIYLDTGRPFVPGQL